MECAEISGALPLVTWWPRSKSPGCSRPASTCSLEGCDCLYPRDLRPDRRCSGEQTGCGDCSTGSVDRRFRLVAAGVYRLCGTAGCGIHQGRTAGNQNRCAGNLPAPPPPGIAISPGTSDRWSFPCNRAWDQGDRFSAPVHAVQYPADTAGNRAGMRHSVGIVQRLVCAGDADFDRHLHRLHDDHHRMAPQMAP